MVKRKQNSAMITAWVIIGIVTILRMIYARSFLLVPDETNYWQWSRHLAWGYHDQAPMIAWTIRFFTTILGHRELAVRLPSILSMTLGACYLVAMANHWYSSRIALHTAYLSQSILIFNIGAVLATADGLQGAAWVAASYHTARGFEDNRWRQWLLGGTWFGIGILSKYTMILFLPIVLLFGCLTPGHRRRLKSIRPYVGCALGLILFLPVIIWNAQNDWNSLRHVAYLGGANEGLGLHWDFLGDYLASQVGLLTPLVFLLMVATWYMQIRNWNDPDSWIGRFLFFTSFPVVAGFAMLSLHSRVYGNWACFGYLTATLLAVSLWLDERRPDGQRQQKKSRKVWRWTLGSAVAFTLVVFTHVLWPVLPIPAHLDRATAEVSGWKQLGRSVSRTVAAMPRLDETFVFGLDYQTASELAFYLPGNPETVSINRWNRPNVYDYWRRDADLMNQDAVGVLKNGNWRHRLLEVFQRVDPPLEVPVYPQSKGIYRSKPITPIRTFFIYRCYGFKGGLRWLPPDLNDVRVATPTSE